MKDILTHCPDTGAFLAEVESIDPERIVHGEASNPIGVIVDKTPTVRNGAETLAVVRVDAELLAQLKGMTTISILAEVDAYGDLLGAMSTANREIYDRVYPRPETDILDDEGNVVGTSRAPELIGGFA